MTASKLGALQALLVALAAAAFVVDGIGADPLLRNAFVDAGLLAIFVAGRARAGRARDLPLPRGRLWTWAPPAIAAAIAAAPTLGIPYLADDHFLLNLGEERATPWAAMVPDEHSLFLRPIPWAAWWCFGRFSPGDATLAHAVASLAFVATCVLAVPALRRLGVPRGIAVATAATFGAAPLAIETVAWASNLYSVLSAMFFMAALATLPVRLRSRRGSWRRWIAPVAFALAAFFSKEDSFSLPFVAAAAGARWRVKRLGRGLRVAAPIALALAVALLARFALLGGLGGYHDARTGVSIHASRWITAPAEILTTECPAGYFLPKRFTGFEPPWRTRGGSLRLAPLLLLALGGASAAALRWAPRAVALLALLIAPVLTVLPIGVDFGDARQIFLPMLAIALLAATLLAGTLARVPLGGEARRGLSLRVRAWLVWLPVALYVALSIAVGRSNLVVWQRAGEIFESAMETTVPILKAAPPRAVVLADGYPDSIHGALCFRNALEYAFPRATRRTDLDIRSPIDRPGVFDEWIVYDPDERAAHAVRSLEPRVRIGPDAPLRLDFLEGSKDRDACRLRDAGGWNDPLGGWILGPRWHGAALVLPNVEVPKGARVRVDADGAPPSTQIAATFRRDGRWERRSFRAGSALELPDGVTELALELQVQFGGLTVLHGMKISAEIP